MMKTGLCFIFFVLLPLYGHAAVTFKHPEFPKSAHYDMRTKERGTVFDQKVGKDEKKQAEKFKVPANKKAEELQVLNDFKMNLTIIRSHNKKICYLMPLDPNISTQKELKDYVDKVSRIPSVMKEMKKKEKKATFSVAKEVKDRTALSDELASFCAKYPIIRLPVRQFGPAE